eukprot:8714997-Pyramimonas_sp.AAC.2
MKREGFGVAGCHNLRRSMLNHHREEHYCEEHPAESNPPPRSRVSDCRVKVHPLQTWAVEQHHQAYESSVTSVEELRNENPGVC